MNIKDELETIARNPEYLAGVLDELVVHLNGLKPYQQERFVRDVVDECSNRVAVAEQLVKLMSQMYWLAGRQHGEFYATLEKEQGEERE